MWPPRSGLGLGPDQPALTSRLCTCHPPLGGQDTWCSPDATGSRWPGHSVPSWCHRVSGSMHRAPIHREAETWATRSTPCPPVPVPLRPGQTSPTGLLWGQGVAVRDTCRPGPACCGFYCLTGRLSGRNPSSGTCRRAARTRRWTRSCAHRSQTLPRLWRLASAALALRDADRREADSADALHNPRFKPWHGEA